MIHVLQALGAVVGLSDTILGLTVLAFANSVCLPYPPTSPPKREFLIDNLIVRIHSIIEMIWWIGLAPWEFEFPFPGGLITARPPALRSGPKR